jgi:hypothetical protein
MAFEREPFDRSPFSIGSRGPALVRVATPTWPEGLRREKRAVLLSSNVHLDRRASVNSGPGEQRGRLRLSGFFQKLYRLGKVYSHFAARASVGLASVVRGPMRIAGGGRTEAQSIDFFSRVVADCQHSGDSIHCKLLFAVEQDELVQVSAAPLIKNGAETQVS